MNKDPNVALIGKWAVTADAVELNRIVQTATIPSDEFLPSHWPKHDKWTLDEANLLLSGLDPDGTVVGKGDRWITFPNGEFDDELVAVSTLDGRRFRPAFILKIENHLRTENKSTVDPDQSQTSSTGSGERWRRRRHPGGSPCGLSVRPRAESGALVRLDAQLVPCRRRHAQS